MPSYQESYKNIKLQNQNVYAEGRAQTHAGCLIFTSVSVRSYELSLVDSVGYDLVISSTLLAPSIRARPLLIGYPYPV